DEGEPDLVSQVIMLYLDDTPALLNSLREAVSSMDAGNVRMIAHRLKSGSAYLGAAALADLFQQLEDLGQNNELGEAEVFLNRIDNEFRAVSAALLDETVRSAA
ncbi:MAG: Hpt domain-containing protein, partial [Gammaproteobacteria bacterium]